MSKFLGLSNRIRCRTFTSMRSFVGLCALLLFGCGSAESDAGGGGGTSSGGASGTGATSGTGAVGNGGSGGTVGGGGSSSGGTGGVRPSVGCGNGHSTSGLLGNNVTVNGTERSYLFDVAAGYDPNTPVPLVIAFHGSGANGQQAAAWQIDEAAEAADETAVFLYPDAVAQSGGIGWDMDENGMDFAFFDVLLEVGKQNYCIDENRIFVAGFSWGCDFANALGCHRGDVIRGIQCYSGAFYSSGCTSDVPAYRTVYSTPDGTDAYSEAELFGAVEHYRTAQGCSETTQPSSPSPCLAYDGCAKPVIYCPTPNIGHFVGPTAGAETWAFFSSLK